MSLDVVLMLLQQTALAWYISDTVRVVYDAQCVPELNQECASNKCHNASHCTALDAWKANKYPSSTLKLLQQG